MNLRFLNQPIHKNPLALMDKELQHISETFLPSIMVLPSHQETLYHLRELSKIKLVVEMIPLR